MDQQHETLEFTAAEAGERLDKILVAHLGDRLTRSQIQGLIKDGLVTVNEKAIKPGVRVKGGETIRVTIPPAPQDPVVQPEAIDLTVLYEDDDLAVIDKPSGLIVHPGAGNETGTLVNAILARYPQIAQISISPKRRGIVHRLDKDTSGVMLIAKHNMAMHRLMRQFQDRSVDKMYVTLVERMPKTATGRIDAPIGRDPRNRKKMAVLRDGRPSVSEFAVIDSFRDGQTLLHVRLLTGRTHQIRVHMAYINCPVVGDRVYGYRKQRVPVKGQFLHASQLTFTHPTSGERLTFSAPLPLQHERLLTFLRENDSSFRLAQPDG
ncbi:MAG: RluA family pseudouridine synthase [bacterium]|nr:RluA family pseudouridine synthase [bacterium]